MKHAEFLGPPGAGKTTIVRAILSALSDTEDRVVDLDGAARLAVTARGRDRVTRLAVRLTRSAESPRWGRAYARSLDRWGALSRFLSSDGQVMEVVTRTQRLRAGRDLNPELVMHWILNLAADFQLAREASADFDLLLVDEGFSQRAIALLAHGFSDGDHVLLSDYLEAAPLPDLVFVIDTPLTTCEQRLNDFEWPERFEDAELSDRISFLENSDRVAELVARHWADQGVPVVRLDGTTSPDENVALAVRQLNDLRSGR